LPRIAADTGVKNPLFVAVLSSFVEDVVLSAAAAVAAAAAAPRWFASSVEMEVVVVEEVEEEEEEAGSATRTRFVGRSDISDNLQVKVILYKV
jgi:hypothetical protein